MHNNNSNGSVLKRILLGVGLLFAALIVYYIYSHGFLQVSGVSSDSTATILKLSNALTNKPESVASSNQLEAIGDYIVSAPMKDTGVYVANVSIPSILRSVKIPQESSSNLTETMGRNSLTSVAAINGKLISFEGADRRSVDSSNIGDTAKTDVDDTHPAFIVSKQVGKDTVVGYIRDENGFTPVSYNLSTRKTLYYPSLSTSKTPMLCNDYGVFCLFDSAKNSVLTYSKNKSTATEIKLSKGADLALNDGKPIFSVASNTFAITTGRDSVSSNDNRQKTDSKPQIVSVFSSKTSKELRHFTYNDATITNVALSPDARYMAVQTTNQVAIYTLSSGKVVFALPFAANRFAWISDDKFIVTTLKDGIIGGSIKAGSARSIVPYSVVRPTEFSFAEGGYIYFTGYAGSIRGTSEPNVYRANIDRLALDTNKNGLSAFPYQGDNFYVDFIDGKVTIQTTKYIDGNKVTIDTRAQKAALAYAKKQLEGGNYSVRYTYVNFSLDDFTRFVQGKDEDTED